MIPALVLPARSEQDSDGTVTEAPSLAPVLTDFGNPVAQATSSPDTSSLAENALDTALTYQPWSPSGVDGVGPSSLITGAVLSSLTVSGAASVVSPASLVHEPLNAAPVVSFVWYWSAVQVTGPLIASAPRCRRSRRWCTSRARRRAGA